MLRMPLLVAAVAVALAISPASASARAACTLQFDVSFDDGGRFSQDGAGTGACVGNVAGVALDPGTANPTIAGVAAPGGGCARLLEKGALELRPRRAFEMWAPEHLEMAGDWRALGGVLSGTLVTGATAVTISGAVGFAGDCSDRGQLHVELVLGDERPAPGSTPASQPAPAQPAAESAEKPKAKPRARKRCARGKARSRRAKRCRRAARRA